MVVEDAERVLDGLVVGHRRAGLEVPQIFSRVRIDRNDGVRIQVVARTVAAVKIRRRIFDREVHEAEIFIDGNLSPDARVARVNPRLFFPGVVPELALLRNRVEDPEPLAALDVECPDVALDVLFALGNEEIGRAHV